MHRTATFLALMTLVTAGMLPARADLGAAGTRIAVAEGAPRFCMTYGHMDEPELFAPIIPELKRLQVTFAIYGDTCVVRHNKTKVATWRVIRVRDDIPNRRNQSFLLDMGGSLYVPVKRLSKLLPIDLNWDPRNNLLSVVARTGSPTRVASAPRPAASSRPQPSVPAPRPETTPVPEDPVLVPDPAATGSIELTGVTLERVGNQLQVRVRSSQSVRPTVLYVKAPARIALDFPDARWAPGIPLPAGIDQVRVTRIGHPAPGQARLVLEIGSTPVKVTGFEAVEGEVRVALNRETPGGSSLPAKDKARLLAALKRHQGKGAKPRYAATLSSRGGNLFRVPGRDQLPHVAVPPVSERNDWKYIIIHHSAGRSGNAATFNVQHRHKGWDGLAYHFVINNGHGNPDGYLEVSPRWTLQKHGAHAGALPSTTPAEYRNGFNEFGIGICLVGNFQEEAPTDKQLEVLAQLIQELRSQFNIPADHVLGHGAVKGTACPGRSFPWRKLYAMMDLPVPRHLHRHPANLTAARCPWCQERGTEK